MLKIFKSNDLESKYLQTSQTSLSTLKSLKSYTVKFETPSKLSKKLLNAQNIQIKCFNV